MNESLLTLVENYNQKLNGQHYLVHFERLVSVNLVGLWN